MKSVPVISALASCRRQARPEGGLTVAACDAVVGVRLARASMIPFTR
jgi:hypothetical protein